jgi:hypothetical protein
MVSRAPAIGSFAPKVTWAAVASALSAIAEACAASLAPDTLTTGKIATLTVLQRSTMADAAGSADVRSGAGAAPAALGPADAGAWQVLPFHSEVLAVHAALLPSGEVLFAAGSGNSLTRFQSPEFGDVAKKIWVSVVWDPTMSPPPGNDTSFFHPATPHDGAGKVLDFFCGGETFLPDGGLMSAGGTLVFAHPGAPVSPAGRTL